MSPFLRTLTSPGRSSSENASHTWTRTHHNLAILHMADAKTLHSGNETPRTHGPRVLRESSAPHHGI